MARTAIWAFFEPFVSVRGSRASGGKRWLMQNRFPIGASSGIFPARNPPDGTNVEPTPWGEYTPPRQEQAVAQSAAVHVTERGRSQAAKVCFLWEARVHSAAIIPVLMCVASTCQAHQRAYGHRARSTIAGPEPASNAPR